MLCSNSKVYLRWSFDEIVLNWRAVESRILCTTAQVVHDMTLNHSRISRNWRYSFPQDLQVHGTRSLLHRALAAMACRQSWNNVCTISATAMYDWNYQYLRLGKVGNHDANRWDARSIVLKIRRLNGKACSVRDYKIQNKYHQWDWIPSACPFTTPYTCCHADEDPGTCSQRSSGLRQHPSTRRLEHRGATQPPFPWAPWQTLDPKPFRKFQAFLNVG